MSHESGHSPYVSPARVEQCVRRVSTCPAEGGPYPREVLRYQTGFRARVVRLLLWLRWPAAVVAVAMAVQVCWVGDRVHLTTINLPRVVVWRCDAGSVEIRLRGRFPDEQFQPWLRAEFEEEIKTVSVYQQAPMAPRSAWSGWEFDPQHVFLAYVSGNINGRPVAFVSRGGMQLRFPAWPVCLGLAVFAVVAGVAERQLRVRHDECPQCRYRLPKSGVCPECGPAARGAPS